MAVRQTSVAALRHAFRGENLYMRNSGRPTSNESAQCRSPLHVRRFFFLPGALSSFDAPFCQESMPSCKPGAESWDPQALRGAYSSVARVTDAVALILTPVEKTATGPLAQIRGRALFFNQATTQAPVESTTRGWTPRPLQSTRMAATHAVPMVGHGRSSEPKIARSEVAVIRVESLLLPQQEPPWPNGRGVGPLIRRLWARVPQGVWWWLATPFFRRCREVERWRWGKLLSVAALRHSFRHENLHTQNSGRPFGTLSFGPLSSFESAKKTKAPCRPRHWTSMLRSPSG